MLLEYETLQCIWFAIMGVLFSGFCITAGMDFGIMAVLYIVGKKDQERRELINVIGPTWDGNQVWLILTLGALLAAWPRVYASFLSCLYLIMLFFLLPLILRPPSIDYRSKFDSPKCRASWDVLLTISSIIPSFLTGYLVAQLLHGLPIYFDRLLLPHVIREKINWFNLSAIVCGIMFIMAFIMQGCTYLQNKLNGKLLKRVEIITRFATLFFIICFIWFFISDLYFGYGFIQESSKTIYLVPGGWLHNFNHLTFLWVLPVLIFLILFVILFLSDKSYKKTLYLLSSLSLFFLVLLICAVLFPFILPSSVSPSQSLLVSNASSSHLTLMIMLGIVVLFLPLVIAYTAWTYYIVKGPVKEHIY